MARSLLLAAVAAVAAGGGFRTKAEGSVVAQAAVRQLNTYYDWKTGFWGNNSNGVPFWTTANVLETLANYLIVTNGQDQAEIMPMVTNTYTKMLPRYCGGPQGSCWFDDHLWFVHGWARMYEATGNAQYLTQAQTIYNDILLQWGGWNLTCGGINWEKGNAYVNAIPNELFLSASMHLYNATGGNSSLIGNFTLLDWARTDYSWFMASAMPIPQPSGGFLVTDGLSTQDCSKPNPSGGVWTYNQGTWWSGLARLSEVTGQATYASTALANLQAALPYYSANGANVIYERSCGGDGACGGQDAKQFKGVLVRHLGYALASLAAASATPSDTQALYTTWLLNQTDSILASNSLATVIPGGGGLPGLQFGQLWQGPFQWDSAAWVSQAAALDAVLAAIMVL